MRFVFGKKILKALSISFPSHFSEFDYVIGKVGDVSSPNEVRVQSWFIFQHLWILLVTGVRQDPWYTIRVGTVRYSPYSKEHSICI